MGGIAVVDSVEGAEVVWVATWASGSLAWGGTVDAVCGLAIVVQVWSRTQFHSVGFKQSRQGAV